jgi:RNA 3'-terminal phosphate cyclase (ATP)
MISLDGSMGEGGGQVLRTALSLSLVSMQPFTIEKIRAARRNPGLARQHLVAVEAAARVGDADVNGASLHSRSLSFEPRRVRGGRFDFDVGSAGSTTLVLETVLPALLSARTSSRLVLRGGTHNPLAPPYEFIAHGFLPVLARLGAGVNVELARAGYYPRGGGELIVEIEPSAKLRQLALTERGALRQRTATATVAGLPRHIAERELDVIGHTLALDAQALRVNEQPGEWGPGNVLVVEVESEHVTEVLTGFGERGVRAETVAARVAAAAKRYLDSDAAVGEHLADQLLVPMTLAGGGEFTTLAPSSHTRTNLEVIRRFVDLEASMQALEPDRWRIALACTPRESVSP